MADETPIDDQIQCAIDDGVARVTINRPEAGNSLTAHMRDTLSDSFDELSATLGVRAIVLTGAGERHFCTGAGLGGPQKPGPERPADAPDRALGDVARMIRRGWQRLVASILDCEKPVIAAVNGTAAGGGANLVLASDLVVMSERARLIEIFVRRGIIPDAGGCYLLPRIVGLPKAKEIMFFGDDLPAADALRLGHRQPRGAGGGRRQGRRRMGGPAGLGAEQGDHDDEVAAQPVERVEPPVRVRRRGLRAGAGQATADSAEGMKAFMERRDPDFKGW